MGIVGEYIGTIHTIVQNRPLVVEQERVNFDCGPGEPLQDTTADARELPTT
jgi:polyisoprenyl-phosphate glycosyltransferase